MQTPTLLGYPMYRCGDLRLSNGNVAFGSREMSVWLPLFVEYMRVVHGITLVIIKVAETREGSGSARTHYGGWAVDFRSWNLATAQREKVIREAARFGLILHYRTTDQGFEPHLHGMLNVGRWTPCSYQIDATRNGRDGLARNGTDREKSIRPPSAWGTYTTGVRTAGFEKLISIDK